MNLPRLIVVILAFGMTGNAMARRPAKAQPEVAPPAAPEIWIDPELLSKYKTDAALESTKIEQKEARFLAVEPALEFHHFDVFEARNDHFTVPLNAGSMNALAPGLWVGNPNGPVWAKSVNARLGIDVSYMGRDGAQKVHHDILGADFTDNVSIHVLPLLISARLTTAKPDQTFRGFSPWIAAGAGTTMTQVTGSLDGVSQTAWTPTFKLGAGVRYELGESDTKGTSTFGGVSAGYFKISGDSLRARWSGNGISLGADIIL